MRQTLLIIGLGGTISCRFQNDAIVFEHPVRLLGEHLKQAKIGGKYEIQYNVLGEMHSTDVTDEYRGRLVQILKSNPEVTKVMVLYGTNPESVARTMEWIRGASTSLEGKTIVLVGSEFPFGFYHSDAPARLGMALGILEVAAPGLYNTLDI